MKNLILILLIPFASFGQERIIGTKVNGAYNFTWNMSKVVEATFNDLGATFIVDTTYAKNDSSLQVVFSDDESTYTNVFRFETINDTLYTNFRALGCLNSCRKELDCTRCSIASDCTCSCFTGGGYCSEKNLAVFQNVTISTWIRIRIITNQNPEE